MRVEESIPSLYPLQSSNFNRFPQGLYSNTCAKTEKHTVVFQCLMQQQHVAGFWHDTDTLKLAVNAWITHQLVTGSTEAKAVLDDPEGKHIVKDGDVHAILGCCLVVIG